jgi:gluconokinase
LFYLKQKSPDLLKRARYILSSKDYLVYRFTGELIAEQSCAAATQLLDINSFTWDSEGMNLLGISPDLFPPLVDGMKTSFPLLDSVRHEIGLTSKPVVVPGVYDGAALAIGVTGLRPQIGVMNVGTSAMVRVHGQIPVFDKTGEMRLQINTLSADSFLNGGAINNATLPLTWMQNNLFDLDLREFDHFNPHKGPPLFCLPYLTGERDAKVGSNASGVFFGLREQHGKKDLVRALFEGVAYSLALIKNSLTVNDVQIDELRLGGGGANSKGWAKIFADVLNTSIRLPKGEEPALVGNAMIGFSASGRFESLEEAVETMVTTGPVIEPSTDSVKQYAKYFDFFQKLREASAPLFAEQVKL